MAMSSIYQHPTRQNDSFAALLGARIRELRLRVGLTQAELGSPRTRSFISAVEHGRTLPSLRALLQMAERLGVPVAVLLDELELTGRDTYTWLHANNDAPTDESR